MQTLRLVLILLAAVAMVGLLGCDGSSPGLNPTVTFTFEEGTTLPILGANAVLLIKGTAETEDEVANPITDIRWTQSPEIGTFTSTRTVETTWVATNPASITAQTPVTLTLTVETLLGGRTVKTINLLVQPVP